MFERMLDVKSTWYGKAFMVFMAIALVMTMNDYSAFAADGADGDTPSLQASVGDSAADDAETETAPAEDPPPAEDTPVSDEALPDDGDANLTDEEQAILDDYGPAQPASVNFQLKNAQVFVGEDEVTEFFDVPMNKELKFTASAHKGFELYQVEAYAAKTIVEDADAAADADADAAADESADDAVIGPIEYTEEYKVPMEQDEEGRWVVPAEYVNNTLAIAVRAQAAPIDLPSDEDDPTLGEDDNALDAADPALESAILENANEIIDNFNLAISSYTIRVSFLYSNGAQVSQGFAAQRKLTNTSQVTIQLPTPIGYTRTVPELDPSLGTTSLSGDNLTIYPNASGNIDLRVSYEGQQATYTVYHLVENLPGDETGQSKGDKWYTQYGDTNEESGEVDLVSAAQGKGISGFLQSSITNNTVKADGSTEAFVYYDRQTYTILYDQNIGLIGTLYDDTIKIVNDPQSPGRTFERWKYTDAGGTEFHLVDGKMPAENLTAEAQWINGPTTYKVTIWAQSPLRGNNTYLWASEYTLDVQTGDVVGGSDWLDGQSSAIQSSFNGAPSINGDLNYFTLNRATSSATAAAAADGSTSIDVYYDRKVYTLKFIYARKNARGQIEAPYKRTGSTHGEQTPGNVVGVVEQRDWSVPDSWNVNTNVPIKGTKKTEVRADGLTYYYVDVSAKYNSNIDTVNQWPWESWAVNSHYRLQGWVSENGTGYRNSHSDPVIVGPYGTMDKSLIKNPNNLIAQELSAYGQWGRTINNPTIEIYYNRVSNDGREVNDTDYVLQQTYSGLAYNVYNNSIPVFTFPGVTFKKKEGNLGANALNGTIKYYYTRNATPLTLYNGNELYTPSLTNAMRNEGLRRIENAVGVTSKFGGTIKTLENPPGIKYTNPQGTKEWTFAGWYQDSAFTQPMDYSQRTPHGGRTLYAKWDPPAYAIEFDPNGGEWDDGSSLNRTVETDEGQTTDSPGRLSRDGYTLEGWYDEEGSRYFLTNQVYDDIKLTARWVSNTPVFNYKWALIDDATGLEIATAPDGNPVLTGSAEQFSTVSIVPPAIEGYVSSMGNISATVSYEGQVIPIRYIKGTTYRYTINYVDQEGSLIDSEDRHEPYTAIVIEVPEIQHYTFNGSMVDKVAELEWDKDQDNVFTFTYTAIPYTVTYEPGTQGTFLKQEYVTEYPKPTPAFTGGGGDQGDIPPGTPGYTFAGWSPQPADTVTGNVTYTAQWTADASTISFEANGGTTVDAWTGVVDADTNKTEMPFTERDGYTFEGWYDNADFNGDPIDANTPPQTFPVGGSTYYAKWAANESVIAFQANGGSEHAPYTGKTDEPVGESDMPATTRTGYDFVGWFDNEFFAGAQVKALPTTFPAGGITYYAQWEAQSATIAFETNGGSSIEPWGGETDQLIRGAWPTTERAGYTFEGWYADADFSGQKLDAPPLAFPAGTTTYYAKWKADFSNLVVTGFETSYTASDHEIHLAGTILPSDTVTYYDGLPVDNQVIDPDKKFRNVVDSIKEVYVVVERDGETWTNSVPVKAVINPAPVTIRGNNAFKIYGEQDPEMSGSVTGMLNGESLGNLEWFRTAETENNDAVGDDVYFEPRGIDANIAANYDITIVPAQLVIRSSDDNSLAVGATEFTYDGGEHALSVVAAVADTKLEYSTDNVTWQDESPAYIDAGRYFVYVRGTRDGYAPVKEAYPLIINKKDATITVHAATKVFGTKDSDAGIHGEVTGLVNENDLGTISYHRLPDDIGKEDVGADVSLTATYAGNDNYNVTVLQNKLQINPATQTLEMAPLEETYNGNEWQLAFSVEPAEGSTVRYALDGGPWSETIPGFTEVGSWSVTVEVTNPNYNKVELSTSARITKRSTSLTVEDAEKVFGENDPDFVVTADNLVEADDLGDLDAQRAQGHDGEGVGTYTIDPVHSFDNPNYAVSTVSGELTIKPASTNEISAADLVEKVYDGDAADLQVEVAVKDGTTLEYSLNGGLSWSADAPSLVDAGTYRVYMRALNANYVTATKTSVVVISKRSVTLTADSVTKVYDGTSGTDPAFTATVSGDGLAKAGDLNIGVQRVDGLATQDVGTYALQPTYTPSANYSVTTENGEYVITPAATNTLTVDQDVTHTYNGMAPSVNPVVGVAGSALQYSTDNGATWSATLDAVNADTYNVTVRATHKNYDAVTATTTIEIEKAAVSIVVGDANKTFGTADPRQFGGSVTGLVAPNDLGAITYQRHADDIDFEDVGDVIRLVPVYTDNPNYTVSFTEGRLNILAADTNALTILGIDKDYDGKRSEAVAIASIPGTKVEYSLNGTDWTEDPFAYTNATGPLTIQVKATHGNYREVTGSIPVEIRKRDASIEVKPATKAYGTQDPTFYRDVVGLIDANHLGTITVKRHDKDAKLGDVGDVIRLVVDYTANGNYNVSVQESTLSITKADNNILTVTDINKMYDGVEVSAQASASASGSTIEYYDGSDWKADAPTFLDVADTGEVRVRATNPNYTDVESVIKVNIAQRPVTLTANDASKIYDNDPATDRGFTSSVTSGSLVNGGDLGTLSAQRVGGQTDQDVGTYELEPVYAANPNYDVTTALGIYTIADADTNVLSVTGISKSYDGVASKVKASALQPGTKITFSVDGGATWLDESPDFVHVADSTTVKVKATLKGFADQEAEATVAIAKRSATITVDSRTKEYGENESGFSGSVDNLVNPADLGTVVYGRTPGQEGKVNAGETVELMALYDDNPNYDVTVIKGTLSIVKQTKNVITAPDVEATYNGRDVSIAAANSHAPQSALRYSTDGVNYGTANPTFVDAGDHKVYIKVDDPNYEDKAAVEAFVKIEKRKANITVSNTTKLSGRDEPTFTGVVSGLVNDTDLDPIDYVRVNPDMDADKIGDRIELTANYAANANYNVTVTNGYMDILAAGTNQVRVSGGSKVYDGVPWVVQASAPESGTTIEYNVNGSAGWTIDAPELTDVGIYTVQVRASHSIFPSTTDQAVVVISAATAFIVVDNQTMEYGKQAPTLTGTVLNEVATGDIKNVAYRNTAAADTVGTHLDVLDATFDPNPNYQVIVRKGALTVTPSTDELVETSGASAVYDGNAHYVNARALQGATLSFSQDNGATWEPDNPAFSDAGTHTVLVRGEQANYATDIKQATLTVAQKPVTLKADDAAKERGDTDPAFTSSLVDGTALVDTNDLGKLGARRADGQGGEEAGSYALVPTYTPNPNYKVTEQLGTLRITETGTNALVIESVSKEYDGQPASVKAGALPGSTIEYSLDGTNWQEDPFEFVDADDVQTVQVRATHPKYSDVEDSGTVHIRKRSYQILMKEADKLYGEDDPAFDAFTVGSLVDPDHLGKVQYKRIDDDAEKKDVGSDITITAEYDPNDNYDVQVQTAKLNIAPAKQQLSVDNVTTSFDNEAHAATVEGVASGSTVEYSTDDGASWQVDAPGYVDAGTHVYQAQVTNPNYQTETVKLSVTITPRDAAIVVHSATKTEGEDDPVFSGTVTGLVAADHLGTIAYGRAAKDADKQNAGDDIDLIATYRANPNYAVQVVSGKLAIVQAGTRPVGPGVDDPNGGNSGDPNGGGSNNPSGGGDAPGGTSNPGNSSGGGNSGGGNSSGSGTAGGSGNSSNNAGGNGNGAAAARPIPASIPDPGANAANEAETDGTAEKATVLGNVGGSGNSSDSNGRNDNGRTDGEKSANDSGASEIGARLPIEATAVKSWLAFGFFMTMLYAGFVSLRRALSLRRLIGLESYLTEEGFSGPGSPTRRDDDFEASATA